jgi:hypothetical protein
MALPSVLTRAPVGLRSRSTGQCSSEQPAHLRCRNSSKARDLDGVTVRCRFACCYSIHTGEGGRVAARRPLELEQRISVDGVTLTALRWPRAAPFGVRMVAGEPRRSWCTSQSTGVLRLPSSLAPGRRRRGQLNRLRLGNPRRRPARPARLLNCDHAA